MEVQTFDANNRSTNCAAFSDSTDIWKFSIKRLLSFRESGRTLLSLETDLNEKKKKPLLVSRLIYIAEEVRIPQQLLIWILQWTELSGIGHCLEN